MESPTRAPSSTQNCANIFQTTRHSHSVTGWAWHTLMMSSAEALYSIASIYCLIDELTCCLCGCVSSEGVIGVCVDYEGVHADILTKPMIWTPRILPVFASLSGLTRPSASAVVCVCVCMCVFV